MNDRERAIRQRLKDDFPHYAEKCLQIRTKEGKVRPFALNRAQQYLHERLEEQKRETGKVRALVLKGRQQGVSTYIGGRYYHAATHQKGQRVFILTHEREATDNLFDMVDRFHENCPDLVRPSTGAANAKELDFSLLDSGYRVGTAGTKAVGRSQTIQMFHGSEVAFWPHADTHAAGVLQAVPDLPGTEEILESTGNGLGNFFHKKWQEAEAGTSDFIAVFIPWFWQDEYRRPADNLVLSDEDVEYQEAHKLDDEQMAWRQAKIIDLDDELLFKQEYPATADEAFQTTGHDSYIKPAAVLKARKNTVEGIGPLIVGADPARFGDDRFSLGWRQGRKVSKTKSRGKIDTVAGANWIKQVIDSDDPDAVFVDVGGLGAGVVDILHNWGGKYKRLVVPINFGSAPQEPEILLPDGTKKPGPRNRRAEMWMRSKGWLDDVAGVDIPDDDTLQADACAPGYSYDTQQRLLLESKEHMRARGVRSPDDWDCVALTFAEPPPKKPKPRKKMRSLGAGGWMA